MSKVDGTLLDRCPACGEDLDADTLPEVFECPWCGTRLSRGGNRGRPVDPASAATSGYEKPVGVPSASANSGTGSSTGPAESSATGHSALVLCGIVLAVCVVLRLFGIAWPLFFAFVLLGWGVLLHIGEDIASSAFALLVGACGVAGAVLAGDDHVLIGFLIGAAIPVVIVLVGAAVVVLGPGVAAGVGVYHALDESGCGFVLGVLAFLVVLGVTYAVLAFAIAFAYCMICGELAIAAAQLATGMADAGEIVLAAQRGYVPGVLDAIANALSSSSEAAVAHVVVLIGSLAFGAVALVIFVSHSGGEDTGATKKLTTTLATTRKVIVGWLRDLLGGSA